MKVIRYITNIVIVALQHGAVIISAILNVKREIYMITYEIYHHTAIREASCGFFKEAIVSIRLVICLVCRNCVDVIIVSRIHSGVSKYVEGSSSTTYPASN